MQLLLQSNMVSTALVALQLASAAFIENPNKVVQGMGQQMQIEDIELHKLAGRNRPAQTLRKKVAEPNMGGSERMDIDFIQEEEDLSDVLLPASLKELLNEVDDSQDGFKLAHAGEEDVCTYSPLPEHGSWKVRNTGYFSKHKKQRTKVASLAPVFTLVQSDWFYTPEQGKTKRPVQHYTYDQRGYLQQIKNRLAQKGKDVSELFFFVWNWNFGSTQLVHIFAADTKAPLFQNWMRRFYSRALQWDANEYQTQLSKRLKLIPRIDATGFFLRKTIGAIMSNDKPALLGKPLNPTFTKTDFGMEVYLNVGASSAAKFGLSVMSGKSTQITADLAFLFEAQKAEDSVAKQRRGEYPIDVELPEQLLADVHVVQIDFDKRRKL